MLHTRNKLYQRLSLFCSLICRLLTSVDTTLAMLLAPSAKAIANITANPKATGADNERAISSPPGSMIHPHQFFESIHYLRLIPLPRSFPVDLVPIFVLMLPVIFVHLHQGLEVVTSLLLHLPLFNVIALEAYVLCQSLPKLKCLLFRLFQ